MSSTQEFNSRFLGFIQKRYPEASLLQKAIEYSLSAPGKRLRPRFVMESSEQIGLATQASELLAFSMELVHIFSLVHDDLPCLDNDDLRRGIPTTHKKFDEAQALLAGDAMLVMAAETFSLIAPLVEPAAFQNAFQFS